MATQVNNTLPSNGYIPLKINPGQNMGVGGGSTAPNNGLVNLPQMNAPMPTQDLNAISNAIPKPAAVMGAPVNNPPDPNAGTGAFTGYRATADGYKPNSDVNGPGSPAPTSNIQGLVPVGSFPGMVGNLSGTANSQSPAYMDAMKQYNTANEELKALKTSAANNQMIGAGTSMAEYAGTQGLLANRIANQENALTSEMNAAGNAAGIATGQQNVQQSGLGVAAGLAAPQAGQSPATQYFNPMTGQYSPLAANSAGGAGQTAQEAMANVGKIQGGASAGASLVPLQQALAAGKGESQNVQQYIKDNPGLNPTGSTLANGLAQWVSSGQFGDPKYQTLANYLTAYATQMAPLLANGGSVTNMKLAMQQSLINGQASGQSISQVLNQLDAEAEATYKNRESGAGGGGTVSGGSSVTNVPGGTNPPKGGNTFGSFRS